MKKHHLINSQTGNCFCGINPDNQLIAFDHDGQWFDSGVNLIDHSNYLDKLCVNCMKQHDIQLIEKFEMDAFLIDYANRIPSNSRAMKFFKCQSRRKRQSIDRSKPKAKPANQSKKTNQSKPSDKPIIEKSDKGKARDARKKANQLKKADQSKPSDDKCKVINKPKNQSTKSNKNDTIKKESKKANQSKAKPKEVIKEVIVDCDPDPDWSIGDPINDKSIVELAIGDDWKLIRHSKNLNQWKFVNRQVVKGIPKWIDDSEFLSYKEASQLVIDGYCE